jgi:ABC-type Fe3+-siderophore transport system permease subunit
MSSISYPVPNESAHWHKNSEEPKMAGIISIISMLVGAIGIFLGFFYRSSNPLESLGIVTVTTVGVVGVLAFVRHVVFHKSDAKRLGWETEKPDWMFEVGFANLAFGLMGFLSVLEGWGMHAQVVVLLGYAFYLFQAACLHGYRYFADNKKSPARFWRSFIATLLYAGMMAFFAISALLSR